MANVPDDKRCPGWKQGFGNCPGLAAADSMAQPVESAYTGEKAQASDKKGCAVQ